MGRRRVDWIQLGILVVTILAAYWRIAESQGKMRAQLDALQAQADRIERRLDDLSAKK